MGKIPQMLRRTGTGTVVERLAFLEFHVKRKILKLKKKWRWKKRSTDLGTLLDDSVRYGNWNITHHTNFETSALNDHENNFEHYNVKYAPHICKIVTWCHKFISGRSTDCRFRVTSYFETSAPKDPKMALNTTRSKVPHVCSDSTSDSQILLYD